MGNYGTISRIYTVDYGIKIKSPDAHTKTIEIGNVPELPRIGALRMLAQPPENPTSQGVYPDTRTACQTEESTPRHLVGL